jgi:hypothetical protein
MNMLAYFLVALTCVLAWTVLTLGLLKFNIRIQPSAVVLSVIDSAQSPELRRPLMISIHGVTIAANNSSRLFDTRKSRLSGILKCHVNPWLL